jgi:hypothetical protein
MFGAGQATASLCSVVLIAGWKTMPPWLRLASAHGAALSRLTLSRSVLAAMAPAIAPAVAADAETIPRWAMTDQKRLSVILAIGLAVAGILCLIPNGKPEPKATEWRRSYLEGPPESKPIAAMWIVDGQPCVYFVERFGERYYEYNPAPLAPLALLYTFPPEFWSEMPGSAE